MSVVERIKQLTVKHLAIFGLLLLSAVALIVIGASLLKIINQVSGWIYVGLSVVVFLSLVVVFISPNSIEANVPGFGPVSVDGSNSSPQKPEKNVVGGESPYPEDFGEYAELTREISPELSTQLFQIQQAGYSDPFEATSAIISEGIGTDNRNPVQETIDILNSDLEARDFILNSENHDMTVVDIFGERYILKVSVSANCSA